MQTALFRAWKAGAWQLLQDPCIHPRIASESGTRCRWPRRPLGGVASPARSGRERAQSFGLLGARQPWPAEGGRGRGRCVRAGPRPGRRTVEQPRRLHGERGLRAGAGPAGADGDRAARLSGPGP